MQNNQIGNFKNEVTLCDKHLVHSKPKDFDVRQIQMKKNSVIKEVTPQLLGELMTTGHSIHYAVCTFEVVPTGTFDKNGNPEYIEGKRPSFQDKSALHANVFGIDIDHGNFSVEDILNKSIVKPAVIHETHSSKEGDRRYRVYFFANANVEFSQLRTMNTILNLPFWDGLSDCETELVDKSCINESRVFYSGSKLIFTENSYFNPFELLNNQALVNHSQQVLERVALANSRRLKRGNIVKKAFNNQLISKEEYNTFMSKHTQDKHNVVAWRENIVFASKLEKELEILESEKREATKRRKTKVDNKTGEVTQDTKSTVADLTGSDFLDVVLANLKALNKDGIEQLDFTEAEEFIHKLDLDEVIGVKVGESFLCPFHVDTTPSASLFSARKGNIMFKCFTDCTETLDTMGFLRKLMNEHGVSNNYYETIRVILEAMGITLGNKYQDQVYLQLVHIQNFLTGKRPKFDDKGDIINRESLDDLTMWMYRHNLFVFMSGMIDLALFFAPKKPVKKTDEGAVISISRRSLYAHLNGENIKGVRSAGNCANKVNILVFLGFLKKVHFSELNEETQKVLLASKKEIENEINQKRRIKNKHSMIEVEDVSIAHTSYYEFMPINGFTWKKAEQRMKFFVENGCKVSTFNAKQLAYLMSLDKAKEIYIQTSEEKLNLNKRDVRFIHETEKALNKILSERRYFTEKELITQIDKKSKFFKKKDKENLGKTLFPGFFEKNGFKIVTVNKKTRETYGISEKYKSSSRIIVK